MKPRTASNGTVAVLVRKSAAVVMTTRLKVMSVVAITRARPRRSAITPPNGNITTSGTAWAANTMLSDVGVLPGKARTPNARAIGATPLPTLLIVRATKNRR